MCVIPKIISHWTASHTRQHIHARAVFARGHRIIKRQKSLGQTAENGQRDNNENNDNRQTTTLLRGKYTGRPCCYVFVKHRLLCSGTLYCTDMKVYSLQYEQYISVRRVCMHSTVWGSRVEAHLQMHNNRYF